MNRNQAYQFKNHLNILKNCKILQPPGKIYDVNQNQYKKNQNVIYPSVLVIVDYPTYV